MIKNISDLCPQFLAQSFKTFGISSVEVSFYSNKVTQHGFVGSSG